VSGVITIPARQLLPLVQLLRREAQVGRWDDSHRWSVSSAMILYLVSNHRLFHCLVVTRV
jgi:hypothetical protein